MGKEVAVRKGYRNIIALGFVSLFTDLSTEMILGLLPIFILKELGGTKMILGFIEGLGESVGYMLRIVSGTISDRVGKRKPLIILGYTLSTISKPLFAITQVWSHALTVRVSDRVGKGLRTAPRDALISESVEGRKMGKAFGIHRTLDQTGAILGPLMAFTLLPLYGMRGVFWFSFIPGLAAVLILLFFVKEFAVLKKKRGLLENIHEVLQPRFTALIFIISLFSIGAYNFSFILVKASELGVNEQFIPVVYMVINIFHTIIGVPTGILADRVGCERVLAFGFTTLAATSLFAIFLNGSIYAYFIAAFYGLYIGIIETTQRAVIPKYSPNHLRGTAYGLYNISIGSCYLAANFIFGALWQYLGGVIAFTYTITTSILATIGILIFILNR